MKWDKKVAKGAAADSDSDNDSFEEADEEEKVDAEKPKEGSNPKPRKSYTSSDGIVFEDWSILPDNLLLGNSYKFVYVRKSFALSLVSRRLNCCCCRVQRIINNGAKEIKNVKISFKSSMTFHAFQASKDHNSGYAECLKKVLVDSGNTIKPGQQYVAFFELFRVNSYLCYH